MQGDGLHCEFVDQYILQDFIQTETSWEEIIIQMQQTCSNECWCLQIQSAVQRSINGSLNSRFMLCASEG